MTSKVKSRENPISRTRGFTLPPQLRGLIHLIGTNNIVNVSANAYIKGSLVVDGTVNTSGQSTCAADPSLLSTPPLGYGKGNELMIAPGSWVWDSVP